MLIELPALAVSTLCDAAGMPWPMPYRPALKVRTVVMAAWVQRFALPIPLTTDTSALLCLRMARVQGLGEVRAAWVARADDGMGEAWCVIVPGQRYPRAMDDGIPDGVTDPDEALAWAVCWWAMVDAIEKAWPDSGTVPTAWPYQAPKGWADVRHVAAVLGVPLLLPLRDGVAMEVPGG